MEGVIDIVRRQGLGRRKQRTRCRDRRVRPKRAICARWKRRVWTPIWSWGEIAEGGGEDEPLQAIDL